MGDADAVLSLRDNIQEHVIMSHRRKNGPRRPSFFSPNRYTGILLGISTLLPAAENTAPGKPPVAKRIPEKTTLHNDSRIDEYSWLRDIEDPATRAYLEAENQYAEAALKPLQPLVKLLGKEIQGRIVRPKTVPSWQEGSYTYYTRSREGSPHPLYCRKKGRLFAKEEVLLDVASLADGNKNVRVGTFRVSPDHSRVAYSIDRDGRGEYSIHLRAFADARTLGAPIEGTTDNLAWSADGTAIIYTRSAGSGGPRTVWLHRLGEKQDDDLEEILEEGDKAHQIGNRRENRTARIKADLCDAAGLKQLAGAKAAARSDEAKPGEAFENDAGERVPVADDVGEDADEERFLDEPGEDVVVGAPGPEERSERHVDDDQGRCQEGDVAAEQAEAAVDVGGEDLQEPVNDANTAHILLLLGIVAGKPEKSAALLCPGGATHRVDFQLFRRHRSAARKFRLQRIVGHGRNRWRFRSDRIRQLNRGEERSEPAQGDGDGPDDLVGRIAHGYYRNMLTAVGV